MITSTTPMLCNSLAELTIKVSLTTLPAGPKFALDPSTIKSMLFRVKATLVLVKSELVGKFPKATTTSL